MFKRKQVSQENQARLEKSAKKKLSLLKISIYGNIILLVIAAFALTGGLVIHQTNTNPQFCGLCHVMKTNVQSYLTSNHLDHVHQRAGVQCKDCHDYPLTEEIKVGIEYITGNYFVDENDNLPKRKFGDALCNKCHISMDHIAEATDYLAKNPHNSGMGIFECNTCHVSHGAQIDYCSECHDNGGQRMIEGPISPRGTIGLREAILKNDTITPPDQ